MAIKISGSTIVDDSRQLVNVGTSTVSASSNLHVGAGITMYGASGIISATSFYGSGQNLTDLIGKRITDLPLVLLLIKFKRYYLNLFMVMILRLLTTMV